VLLPKLGLTETAAPAADIAISLVGIKAVQAVSNIPGEVNGPALEVTVQIANSAATVLDLDHAMVDLLDSTGAPGLATTTTSVREFAGELATGASATGVYVYRVPTDRRDPITVQVQFTAGEAVAQFSGNAN
jgi:tetrahydromethanopterin S-methyltransferase subunit D